MHPSINVLVNEHRVIESAFYRIENECSMIVFEKPPNFRSQVRQWVHFIREFSDRVHHGKEENLLFAEMCKNGFSWESGAVASMLAEHDEFRENTSILEGIAAGSHELDEAKCDRLLSVTEGYCNLLRVHIAKEDNILFPTASQVLPPNPSGCWVMTLHEWTRNLVLSPDDILRRGQLALARQRGFKVTWHEKLDPQVDLPQVNRARL